MNLQTSRIDSLEKIRIGGCKQWIAIRSKKPDGPILLFLHGGPGTAQIFFSRKPQIELEDHFIVVNWDQRGAGKSYNKSIKRSDMTIDTFLHDAQELMEYLIKRFEKEKIFLVGHSWGSILGIKLAATRPDLIFTYIGIGQVVDMKRGETISYNYTLRQAIASKNNKAIRELKRIGLPPYPDLNSSGVQRKWLSVFKGTMQKGNIYKTIFSNMSLSDVSISYLIKFVKGIVFSLQSLENEQMNINIMQEVRRLDMPVFFCEGKYDYTVPFELVEEYIKVLEAPQKKIVWFENSGHLPNFEEPKKFNDFCISLL
ncbi:alpha/beta hydrolase [Leptospira langatensis]|uniref:Alpha/beta hydrolase n=1 Tax=Leptospira langatensis TaxID=2484983 RepID=A0A5F1ZSI2_9LEPT|nr:alpha/beta hydrolase [Leptospira langatensis]TGJ98692.1 alpha/beta hydrolase [Leptospira langatensis]TGL40742.1 alpha/beta hydrolase [Leptospira langatensis]